MLAPGYKMKTSLIVFSLFGIPAALLWQCASCSGREARRRKASASRRHWREAASSRIYALDPLSRALCFRDGREGMAFQNNRWANRCSDLSYSLAGDGSFVTGIEATRVAAIIDLGTAASSANDMASKTPRMAARASLRCNSQGNRIVILKEDNPNETLQALQRGTVVIYRAWTIGQCSDKARPYLSLANRGQERQQLSTNRQVDGHRIHAKRVGDAALGPTLTLNRPNRQVTQTVSLRCL